MQKAYTDVYKPEKLVASPDAWRRVFLKGAETPLRVTRHGLKASPKLIPKDGSAPGSDIT